MIEKELKAVLAKELFNTVLKIYSWDEKITQTNYYYDDEKESLLKNGITIRVRKINNRNILQIKKTITSESALHIKDEYEEDITDIPEFINCQRINILSNIDILNIKKIGCLTTERRICNWNDQIQICLDKNNYLGVTDYEIELEFIGTISDELLSELACYGILFCSDTKGKFTRFMKIYKEMKCHDRKY